MAKKRIHQIAKELDIASADVLHKAKELGFEVKTASSGLVPEDEELLKLAFAEESSEQDIEEETSVEINEEATLTEEDQVIEKDETIDEVENVDINIIEVTEGSTPEEIASIFDLDATTVVADLMSLGIMQSLTSTLNNDEIEKLFEKYNAIPEFAQKVEIKRSDIIESEKFGDDPDSLKT